MYTDRGQHLYKILITVSRYAVCLIICFGEFNRVSLVSSKQWIWNIVRVTCRCSWNADGFMFYGLTLDGRNKSLKLKLKNGTWKLHSRANFPQVHKYIHVHVHGTGLTPSRCGTTLRASRLHHNRGIKPVRLVLHWIKERQPPSELIQTNPKVPSHKRSQGFVVKNYYSLSTIILPHRRSLF